MALLLSIRPAVLTAVAYALAGWLALWLASPPGYAAPLYPSAGIALAAALTYGRRALPGVLLGALLVDAMLVFVQTGTVASSGKGLALALGATSQAALGAWLLRRRLGPAPEFSAPRHSLLLFSLGGVLACTVSAGTATLTLQAIGMVPAKEAVWHFLAWWLGDSLGVMLATPIALTAIGEPRALWARRRVTVALPMLALMAAVGVATVLVSRGTDARTQASFEREASHAAEALERGLRQPLSALQAIHSVYLGSEDVSDAEFKAATRAWLAQARNLAAIGFSPRVPVDQLAQMSAKVRREDGRVWRVFNRSDAPAALTAGDTEVVAILRVEPREPNQRAMGVNVLSIPAAREAIARAEATGRPAATAGFKLTQSLTDEAGVVIYRTVHRQEPPMGEAPRRDTMLGVVFVTLRTEEAARSLLATTPTYLQWCLLDRTPGALRPLLAGRPGCDREAAAGQLSMRRYIDFAERQWELRLSAKPSDVPVEGRWTLALFAVSGLVSTGLLGMLLLSMTGHHQRVEAAVQARTVDLRREIQERLRAEQALRDSEQRWRNIVDHIPIGVVYADLAGRIRETNPRLREMLGLDADALEGRKLAELGDPQDSAATQRLLEHLVSGTQGTVERRQSLLRPDGRRIWCQWLLSVLRDPQGQPLRVVAVVEDITEHLRLADAERAREAAEAASQAKSAFLSRVSHELRTPLNAILGFGQLMGLDREPALSPRQREWNDQVQQAGWHLLSLINEMMDLSRIESGQLHLAISAVSPEVALRESLAMIGPSAQARAITVAPPQLLCEAPVLADPTRLRQVLANLLSNAVKYNRDGGTLRSRIDQVEVGWVRLSVSDEGAGLSEDELGRLFTPFQRLGKETTGVEGTGLGLVISRSLAEAMGGRLEARSQPGEGATFSLSLPQAPTGQPTAPLPPALAATAPGPVSPPAPAPRALLYIEDNETNAEVMRGLLSAHTEWALDVAPTGTEGLARLRAAPPDLLLLDMHLPDMDGLEVLAALKADPVLHHIPVLGVSADATPERLARAQALGIAGYLTKPVDVEQLLAALQHWLSD